MSLEQISREAQRPHTLAELQWLAVLELQAVEEMARIERAINAPKWHLA